MSAATVSLKTCQEVGLGEGCLSLMRPAHHLFSIKLLGFSNTEEIKYKHRFIALNLIQLHSYCNFKTYHQLNLDNDNIYLVAILKQEDPEALNRSPE